MREPFHRRSAALAGRAAAIALVAVGLASAGGPAPAQAGDTALTFFGTAYGFAIPPGYQLRKRYDTATAEVAILDAADDTVRLTFTATKALAGKPEPGGCVIDGRAFQQVPYAPTTDVDVAVCRLAEDEHAALLVRFGACGPACTLRVLVADRHATPDLSLVAALERSVAAMGR